MADSWWPYIPSRWPRKRPPTGPAVGLPTASPSWPALWTHIIIMCKMLYWLKIVSPHEYSSNCNESLSCRRWRSTSPCCTLSTGLGCRRASQTYTQNRLHILLLLVFDPMVYQCQGHHCPQYLLAPLPAKAVCADDTAIS